ncbi:MAG: type II toxin-antitoxin system RelE/ParE family toxin [Deltaproteobacteria bacterium]|nr:type II toxin-antitoxin system RelE/ParE family toxin [Deltaproteobacteria bacterium]MBW1859734.1 type II toxin-antitoxin system RelE/ParE family toxin [Deltaproteobacteria bacterium]
MYRIRIGDYRVIYSVHKDAKEVVIHYVRHRRDAYRQL